MGMRQSIRPRHIAVTDRGKHVVMLAGKQDLFLALFEIGEMQVQHPTALIQQSLVKS